MPDEVPTYDICSHCGVCCTGAFFSHVPLVKPDDRTKLEAHGYEFADADADEMPLPCRYQQGALCSIYHSRPHICGAYRCEVLKSADGGMITTDEAIAHARELVRLYRDLRSKMRPGETLAEMRERVKRLRAGEEETTSGDAELMLAFYAFNIYADRHFHAVAQRHVEYAGNR